MSIRPTILVIEDEAALRDILDEALHAYGYSAVTAATVEEAEEIRQRLHPEVLALVLADINLSHTPQGQEGYDLCQRWLEAQPALPFVLMSGASGNLAWPMAHPGSVRFLAKPFDLDELLAVVQTLLRAETAIPRRP